MSAQGDYKCQICGATFKTQDELLKHADIKHATPMEAQGTKQFRCVECGAAFKSQPELERHSKTHDRARA